MKNIFIFIIVFVTCCNCVYNKDLQKSAEDYLQQVKKVQEVKISDNAKKVIETNVFDKTGKQMCLIPASDSLKEETKEITMWEIFFQNYIKYGNKSDKLYLQYLSLNSKYNTLYDAYKNEYYHGIDNSSLINQLEEIHFELNKLKVSIAENCVK